MTRKHLSKEDSRKRFSELRELWCEWDPIGVMSEEGWPRDEYDTYVGKLMRLLETESSEDEIVEYLEYVVGEYIGLGEEGIEWSNPRAFSKVMRTWFAERWGNLPRRKA